MYMLTYAKQWAQTCALFFGCILLSSTFSVSNASEINDEYQIKTKPGPPPGFEELATSQTTAVDIYYEGKLLGSTIATFTPTSIKLETPAEVVSFIPRISNKVEVTTSLTGELPINSDKVCLSDIQRDCGYLEPPVAGVIFDESYYKLFVFINAFYLLQEDIVRTKYLPESTTGFSTVNLFTSSISGSDGTDAYTIGAQHIASLKQSRFQFEWDYTNTQNLSVDNFSIQHDKSIWSAEAGVFESSTQNSTFITQSDLLGARIYSSTNTRTDLAYSQSTEIFLFLATTSFVEIFKDDKLVTANEYQPGNQQIDTLLLPSGSYPIVLRITDSQGNVREEEFFFAKSGLLPPKDQPLYFAELGKIGDPSNRSTFPKYTNEYLGRAGASYRLHDNFGINLEGLHGADTSLIQGGMTYLGSNYNLQSNLMRTSDSDWGVDIKGQLVRNNFNLNFSFRKVERNEENFDFDSVELLPNSFTQGTASASTAFAGGTLSFRARYNERLNQESTESLGILYRKPILRKNGFHVNLTSSSFIQDDDLSFRLGLSFNRNSDGKYLFSNVGYAFQDTNEITEHDYEFNGQATYSGDNPTYGDYSLGLFANDGIGSRAIGARAQSHSSIGKNNLTYELIKDKSSGNFSRYYGDSSFSVFSSGKDIAWGGKRNAQAGVIVALDSELSESPFEVFIDRQPKGYAKSGKSTVVGLVPYKNYQVQIKPRGDELVQFEDTIRNVTLYPGNVETLHWNIRPITILISNAVFENGKPVSYAKFENTINFASTDDSGWFQIEIADFEPLVLSKNGKPVCKITIPEVEIEQGIAYLEEVICSPILD